MYIEISKENIKYSGVRYKKNNISIFFRGYIIYENKLFVDDQFITFFENNLKSNLKKIISNLNGNYLLVFIENQSVTIVNDRYGSHAVYYYSDNNKVCISTDWKKLIKFSSRNYNRSSVIEYISFGHTLGTKTLLNDIFQFEPACIYEYKIDGNSIIENKNKYWQLNFKFNNYNIKKKEKEFLELWQSQFSIYADYIKNNNNKSFVPLTSGLDSRFISHSLDKENIEIYAYTHACDEEYFELDATKKVAQSLINLEKHLVVFVDEEFMNSFVEGATNYNIISTARPSIEFNSFLNFKDEIKAFMPGFSGDFVAGSHLYYRMKYWKNNDIIPDYILKYKLSPFGNELITKNIESKNLLYESIKNTINNDFDPISSFIEFDLNERQRKYFIQGANQFNSSYQFLPFFDYKILDFFLEQPLDALLNTKLYTNAQLKYFYNDNPSLLKAKRENKSPQRINNNLLKEYSQKFQTIIKKYYKTSNNENNSFWGKDINWMNYINRDDINEILNDYSFSFPTKRGYTYDFFLVNLSLFHKYIKQYKE